MDGDGSLNMDSGGTSDVDSIMDTPEFKSAFSEGTDVFIGLYITIIGLVSVSANIAVLWGLFKKKQDITDMDVITINICICQVAPAILSYPMVLLSAFSHGWYFSEQDCERDGFFIYFFAMTTIGSLLLMTFYRYLRMFHGHLFTKHNNPRVRLLVFIGLGVCYLYGLLWALPPLLGYGSYVLESHHLACSLDWTSLPLLYISGILTLGYFAPMIVMISIYGCIVATVRSSNQQISSRSSRTFRKDYHVTIVSILHCGFFLLVWTPYAILSFMVIFSVHVPNSLYLTSSFFAKIDTLVNPFVFFILNKMVLKGTNVRQRHAAVKKRQVQFEEVPMMLIAQKDSAESRLIKPTSSSPVATL